MFVVIISSIASVYVTCKNKNLDVNIVGIHHRFHCYSPSCPVTGVTVYNLKYVTFFI